MPEKIKKSNLSRHHGPEAAFAGEKSSDMLGALREFFRYIGANKWPLLFASLCAILGSLLNLAGPEFLRRITDLITAGLTGSMDLAAIEELASWMIILYLLGFILVYSQNYLMAGLAQKIALRLRRDIAAKLNRLPLRYFDTASNGDLLSRVTNDVDSVGQNINHTFAELAANILQFLTAAALMFWTNVYMALASIALSLLGIGGMTVIMLRAGKFFRAQQKGLGDIDGLVEEVFTAHAVVRAFNGETAARQQFQSLNERLYGAVWRAQFFSGMMLPLMLFLGTISYVGICVLGAALTLQGTITFGTIIAFMLYTSLFMEPLQHLAQSATSLQTLTASAERIFHFLAEPEQTPEPAAAAPLTAVRGDVVFEDVHFSYTPEHPIIRGFSAHILPGQKAAIVGPTGAGKTTLVNLLERFYEIDSGQIRIDGVPIQDLPRAQVRELFAMVLQDTWIFEGTIRENIVYNRQNVSDAQLQEILRAVGLQDLIAQLPQGIDTRLDENANLSAGQRQLLTIARAMLADAPLLILDEATSSVDTRTELCVQQAMDRLMQGRTSFVIAHRLSTIRNADIILVLQDGDIVESGSHEELIAQNGAYAKLYNSQFDSAKEI